MDNKTKVEKIKRLWPYAYNAYRYFDSGKFSEEKNPQFEYIPIRDSLGFGYIVLDHGKKTIHFGKMGTEGEFDSWWKNIDVIKRQKITIDIHQVEKNKCQARVSDGLWDIYKQYRNDIYKVLEKYLPRDYTFHLAGHSQGGAEVQTIKLDCDIKFGLDIETLANASQGVGGPVFCDFMDGKDLLRCNTKYDIVPKMPPWFLGYRHAGEYYELKGKWLPFRIVRGIHNHLPKTYNKRIKEL